MSYSSEVLADSPLGYWRLGESSGTTAADSSGNGRAGSYVGAVTLGAPGLLTGDSDTAMALVADTGRRMAVPYAAWMDLTSAITVEAWVEISGSADGTWGDPIVNKFDSTGSRSWRLIRTSSGWLFTIWFSDGTSAEVTAPAGSGGHLVATWDGSTIALYVNGSLAASAATPAKSLRTGSDSIEVGRYNGTAASVPTATYDEVAIYNHALTGTRVAAHYTAGTVAGVTGTVSASLPALSASLAGGIKFSGTISASLPALGASLAGETYPPGIAGDLAATLPQLGASLVGAYSDTAALAAILPPLSASFAGTAGSPPVTGSLAAVLPSLRSNLAGQSFKPGTEGYVEAFLPALTASLSGDVLGRAGLGLALDSSAVLTVEAALEPEPTVPPGTPSTALHIIAPTVPVPTLVAGRPQ